jgi:hypothetical protein
MRSTIIFFLIIIFNLTLKSQIKNDQERYFGSPIIIDSTNTILIPIYYKPDDPYTKSWKTNYYANILVTKTDSTSSKRMFKEDTYINPLRIPDFYYYRRSYNYKYSKSIYSSWIFYLVKDYDLNKNKKIDDSDPTILYLTDLTGNQLNKLTNESENVLDYYVPEDLGTIIVKIQRDLNNDNEFTFKDKDYYYLFLDYKTLKEIKRVEIE